MRDAKAIVKGYDSAADQLGWILLWLKRHSNNCGVVSRSVMFLMCFLVSVNLVTFVSKCLGQMSSPITVKLYISVPKTDGSANLTFQFARESAEKRVLLITSFDYGREDSSMRVPGLVWSDIEDSVKQFLGGWFVIRPAFSIQKRLLWVGIVLPRGQLSGIVTATIPDLLQVSRQPKTDHLFTFQYYPQTDPLSAFTGQNETLVYVPLNNQVTIRKPDWATAATHHGWQSLALYTEYFLQPIRNH